MQPTSGEPADRPLTHHDLEDLPDDGNRYEVIDGALYVTPFPSFPHQRAATRLTTILDGHVRAHALGEVFAAGLKVVLDEPTGVGPDVVYVARARMHLMREDGYYGAPDLLVEVVSTKPSLDRVVKLRRYAEAGVPHYWIVDPTARALRAYRRDAARYRLAQEVTGEVRFQPELFPGLDIDLAELWV